MEYYNSKEVQEKLRITKDILYRMRKQNILPCTKIGKKTILYRKPEIDYFAEHGNLLEFENKINQFKKLNIIYCRVSNNKQKEDLFHQQKILKDFCNAQGLIPDLILSEIASGMNEDRKEFNRIINLVLENKVNKIFITYKDRFTRFGFKYFENICKKFNTEIVILNNIDKDSFEKELTEDLISIIHHFGMKMYSNRRKQLTKFQKELSGDYNE